jgi:hypothetical protein
MKVEDYASPGRLSEAILAVWKFGITLLLATMTLGFLLAAVYLLCGTLAGIGNAATWLLLIRTDISRHHYSFTLNWNRWTPAEWRLLVWLAFATIIIRKAVSPLMEHMRGD